MTIDWPTGWDRTPPSERERTRKFDSTIGRTTKAIAGEMDRMDVAEWRASTGSGGVYTKSNGLPKAKANPDDPGFVLQWIKDGEQFAVACDHYARLKSNLRAVYLWVNETRMRGQRPVHTGDTAFAAARLPAGDEDTVVSDPPPHEVLDVAPDAPAGVVQAAYREKVKDAHPDQGGSQEMLKRLQRARKQLIDENQ